VVKVWSYYTCLTHTLEEIGLLTVSSNLKPGSKENVQLRSQLEVWEAERRSRASEILGM
jgi:hypothetical protein